MIDPRAGKTFYLNSKEWTEFCDEHLMSDEEIELGFDLGGGYSYTVARYVKEEL